MDSAQPRAHYVDGPAIMQKASEILANNSKFLSTPLDMAKADPWPRAYRRPSRDGAPASHGIRSSTCSPTRGDRHRIPALSHEFQSQLEEVMRGAQKYRRPSSAHSRLTQPSCPPAIPGQAPGPYNTGQQVIHGTHAPPIPKPPSLASLLSQAHHAPPGNFPSAPQSYCSRGTMRHSNSAAVPAQDALALIEAEATASHHQQLRKLYCDVQRGQSMLQQEQQECERLRRTIRERDDAVHNARAHARQAARQLEEEVDRRAAAEKRGTDLQRALQAEQDERKRAEDRARDSRALVRTLEQQLARREPSQRDDLAGMRWELESKCSQVGTLEERLRVVQATLDTRSRALSDAEAALQQSRAETDALRSRHAAAAATAAVPDDAEAAGLQAEIARLNSALQERRSGSGSGGSTAAAADEGGDDSGLELLQLRCTLEAKERELAGVRRELADSQAASAPLAAVAEGELQGERGLVRTLQEQLQEVVEQRRAAERRAAEAEGARALLDAECAALRGDVLRLQAAADGPSQEAKHGVRPGTPVPGARRVTGKTLLGGPDGGDLTVRTAVSNTSAHSWRIEAGTGGSPPLGAAGPEAAAEAARLREELVGAHQLHADLELSSGETIQALQQQISELESQLASEREPGTSAQERHGSGGDDSSRASAAGDSGAAAEWRRKHDALHARHRELQQQLLAVRDIHGIDMPMLAGDVAVVGDGAPTAAAVQATLAAVQARQDEAERRMAEVLQRREAAERKRGQEWQRKVDALNEQVKALEVDLAAAQQAADKASGGRPSEEMEKVWADAAHLRELEERLQEELRAVRADLEVSYRTEEGLEARVAEAEAAAAAAQEQASAAMGEAAEAELRIAAADRREAAARSDAAALRVEVEGLRQQVEGAEERFEGLRGSQEGAVRASVDARAAEEECARLRREVQELQDALAEAKHAQNGRGGEGEDPTGLEGQVRTLREEVLRLKMELEGTSAAAEETEGLRGRVEEARAEAEGLRKRLEAEADEARWCWRQVDELTAESATLRERLRAAESGTPGVPAEAARASQDAARLRQEVAGLQAQLIAAERMHEEMGDLRRQLAGAEAEAAGGEEARVRARELEAELETAQADLREAQAALVAAAAQPADLQAAAEEVWGRVLRTLRQGIAEALPEDIAVREAALAGRDEELVAALAAAVQQAKGGAGGAAAAQAAAAEEQVQALQREVARLQTHRKQLEAQAFEAENSVFEVEKELQAALDGRAAAEAKLQEADRLTAQLRQEVKAAAAALPAHGAGGRNAEARLAEAERRAAAAEDEAASLELTLKEAEQNLTNAYQDIERLRGQRAAPDASAADARRCARVAEEALESERARVAELQRQLAGLQKEAASLKAASTLAPQAGAGRRVRPPQRMRPYAPPAAASPSPQPTVHSEHASSHTASAAQAARPEHSSGSVGEATDAAVELVNLTPHGPEASGGAHTPPWQPLQAAAAATAQSHATHAAAAGEDAAAAGGDGSVRTAAGVAASLAAMHGPGAPEAELSLLEASGIQPATSDPYSHLSLLTPPGPVAADSSESQRSLSGSSRNAPRLLQPHVHMHGDFEPGRAAAAAPGEVPGQHTDFGRRSAMPDPPLEGLGSSGSSGPPIPMPSPTLSPVVGGHGGAPAQRQLSQRGAGEVDESTSQWGATGMGSLDNVIDFLGRSEDNFGSTHLSSKDGLDTAQSATPAAAVQP
eukprot:jgi/Ulvmu1/6698/UM030_0029.1